MDDLPLVQVDDRVDDLAADAPRRGLAHRAHGVDDLRERGALAELEDHLHLAVVAAPGVKL